MDLTVETFEGEILEALKNFDKFIVCLDKTPEDCKEALVSLMDKAIRAYVIFRANQSLVESQHAGH